VGLSSGVRAANDFQLWSELGLRYRVVKGLRLKFDAHFRFDENLSATESLAPEIAMSYRVWKYLRLETGYRALFVPVESREPTYTDTFHRFHFDLRFRYRIKPVTLRYRLRYQEQFGEPWTDHPDLVARHAVRNRLGAEVKTAVGLVPFLSAEIFVRIADPDGPLHKWRATLGVEYEIDAHAIALFYRFEDMLDDPEDPSRHILGLGYHVSF
jgi:hypothetical protein